MPKPKRSRSATFARFVLVALGVGVLAFAVFSPSLPTRTAFAQAPGLSGTWRVAVAVAQAQQTVRQAVEPAIVGLRPNLQPFARQRFAETTWVPLTITIQASAQRINIQYQGQENRTFDTAPGQPTNVFTRSGVRAQLVQTFRPDGSIEQRFTALDGTQWNVLGAAGGRLNLDVVMQSPRLTQQVRFRITYARGR